MMTTNTVARFQELREALKTEANWRSPGVLRDAAAFAALGVEGAPAAIARDMKGVADRLKAEGRGVSFARSAARYALAADLIARGRDVGAFLSNLRAGRDAWKAGDLRRGGFHTDYALILSASAGDGEPVEATRIAAIKSVYDAVKDAHFWHVGPYTLPAAAIAGTLAGPGAGTTALSIYDRIIIETPRLKGRAIAASLLSTLTDDDPGSAAARFSQMFAQARETVPQPARVTQLVALAALSDMDAATFGDRARAATAEIRALRPSVRKPRRMGLAFATYEALSNSSDERASRLSGLINAAQTYLALQAEQAAVIAATSGAVAAAS